MLYLLHGENDLQRREARDQILAQSGPPPDFQDMNTTVLEDAVSLGDLRSACAVVPFLGGVRVVIARDALTKLKGKPAAAFVRALADVPETTMLIFDEGKTLPKRHAIFTKAEGLDFDVRHFPIPKPGRLPFWVQQRARAYGGQIEGSAAFLLAQNLGADLRLLDQEIQKLLLYVGGRREITVDDVRMMVPYVQSADVIFQMVDALGQRDARRAASYLHRLLDVGEHPLGIFGMVVRQFRLLIQIRWLLDRGHTQSQIASRLELHSYVVSKVSQQVGRFTPEQLRRAYRVLAEMDLAIKRGEFPVETALDLLVAQLTTL